jgi:hypothetical protein
MTDSPTPARARAEAAFNTDAPENEQPAPPMDEYKARQETERAKMAKLRALRLAAEAKAAGEPKPKRKPGGGKAKR